MFFMFIMNILIFLILVLVSVAFITLFERKVLGYMQVRMGPNKVGITGILQPFSDAIKLYTKEFNWPIISNSVTFFLSPCLSLSLALLIWISIPLFSSVLETKMSMMIFFSILGLGVYPILISSWSSNSNYSSLGGMRALAQTISYEVSLVFVILSNMILSLSLNFDNIMKIQKFSVNMIFFVPTILWLISILAELNRTPFDFAEGESELVSGFNTEFSSSSFAIIFMAEYAMILFFSMLSTMILSSWSLNSIISLFMLMMFLFFFMWSRATLPRYRYDMLMKLCWKVILPTVMMYMILPIFLVCMI